MKGTDVVLLVASAAGRGPFIDSAIMLRTIKAAAQCDNKPRQPVIITRHKWGKWQT